MAQRRTIEQRAQQRRQQHGRGHPTLTPCSSKQLTVGEKNNLGGMTDARWMIANRVAHAAHKSHRFRGMYRHPVGQQLSDRNSSSSFHGKEGCEIEAILE